MYFTRGCLIGWFEVKICALKQGWGDIFKFAESERFSRYETSAYRQTRRTSDRLQEEKAKVTKPLTP
jgi:hypothetical protein